MGNQSSSELDSPRSPQKGKDDKEKYKSFPGSAILEKTFCGSIDTTDPAEYEGENLANRLLRKADVMCISSPDESKKDEVFFDPTDLDLPKNKASVMLARALVSEVTDNPKTMKQSEMAAREKQLLKAQQAAYSRRGNTEGETGLNSRPVGAPGGVGAPNVLSSIAFAVTGDEMVGNVCVSSNGSAGLMSGGLSQEGRAAGFGGDDELNEPLGPYAVTIGLSLSRRHSGVGHPDTVTRQTAFDFNELQDRSYKYVSSTDASGWRAGGGERGGATQPPEDTSAAFEEGLSTLHQDGTQTPSSTKLPSAYHEKIPSPDLIHIPIIHINCASPVQVDQIIMSLASGEIFIPHMAILPEALTVNGISPPDLVVRFDCERNEEVPPDEWPNWCLEFMHNQLYEYFYSIGAQWMRRPFSITLARKVKWKTVKHMNRYFAHAEQVIERWREIGPQLLDPQLSYIEGGATPEEVAHPHGIYLMRQGVATNYFAPNFDPPYTTRMTRSLLENVLNKSWDRKRQEWSSEPIPKLLTPNVLLAMACGCTDPTAEGFMAREVTAAAIRKTAKAARSPVGSTAGSNEISEMNSPQPPAKSNSSLQQYKKSNLYQSQSNDSSPQHYHQSNSYQTESNVSSPQQKMLSYQSESVVSSPQQSERSRAYESGEMEEEEEEEESYDEEEEEEGESVEKEPEAKLSQADTANSERSSGETPSLTDEEKKTDEVLEKRSHLTSKNSTKSMWKSTSKAMDGSADMDTSFATSLAVSGTTLVHSNLSTSQRQFSIDEWGQPIIPEELKATQTVSKKKIEQQSVRELLDIERKRQDQLLFKVQGADLAAGGKKDVIKGKGSHYTMAPVTYNSLSKRGQDLERSESGNSMDYSQDGSSAFFNEGGSSLFGQQYAGDSLTSSTFNKVAAKVSPKSSSHLSEDDDNSMLLSIQGSGSSTTVVPSDEELLAIGWAKALDASSGNYYYYTLDRKTIVWDNPLSPSQAGGRSRVDP